VSAAGATTGRADIGDDDRRGALTGLAPLPTDFADVAHRGDRGEYEAVRDPVGEPEAGPATSAGDGAK
jgi:hypothetical protein